MRFRRTLALLTALIATALAAIAPATAARTTFRYDTAQRVIKACVLAVDVDTDPAPDAVNYEAANPFVIEGMRRSRLAPEGWVFENPLAPPTVVEGDAPADYAVKSTEAYWRVELTDETASRLVGMDLIYLSASELDLTERQQEGLRAAVEAGAVLWVDNSVSAANPTTHTNVTAFPWPIVFDSTGTNVLEAALAQSDHGLLDGEYALDERLVSRLGYTTGVPDPAPYIVSAEGHFIEAIGNEFRTVVQATGGASTEPFAAVTDYGSGTVLVTTGGVGSDVSAWMATASPGTWRPDPEPLQEADVKFALNAVTLHDRWQQARQTPRASATNSARAPFPLDIAWQFPDITDTAQIGPVVSAPVVDREIVYAVSTPSTDNPDILARVMAFDMDPAQDLNGDNDPNDGFEDYVDGAPYDLIWDVQLEENWTPRYASPTVAAFTHPGSSLSNPDDDITIPQVLLVSYVNTADGTGWVDCYNASLDFWADPTFPTGGLLWRREIQSHGVASDVVALSSPTVHNGYVYVLATEADPTGDPNDTWGRAHCFELDYPWEDTNPWPTDASWWVYPSADADLDGDGSSVGAEPQRSLPPFHDPEWAANAARPPLPPAPGAVPVVHASAETVDADRVDALLTFGTPVSLRWDETAGEVLNIPNAGGSQYTLIPTPLRVDDEAPAKPSGFGLNSEYFLARTNQQMDTYDRTRLGIGTNPVEPAGAMLDDRHVLYNPGAVRESLINALINDWLDPLEAQNGLEVLVDYQPPAPDPAVSDEPHRLSSPVLWRRVLEPGRPIHQPASMRAEELAITSGRKIDYSLSATPGGSGAVEVADASSGATRWSYVPSVGMPGRTDDAHGEMTTAAAMDDETVVVGASAVDYAAAAGEVPLVSSVMGLQRKVDTQIDFRLGTTGEYPVGVSLVRPGLAAGAPQIDQIAPGAYEVDPWAGRLRFPPSSAADVVDILGIALGVPIYGNVIRVEWENGDVEDHIVPEIERFHYTFGFIRLRHRPAVADPATITIERPDGTLIDDASWDWVNFAADFGWPDNAAPADVRLASLDGWIDVSGATDVEGAPVLPGDELVVSYTAWSQEDAQWITIPNASRNIPAERHQLAVEFGPSLSSPAVARDTIHLGTQGVDADLNNAFDLPATNPEARETLLSLMWNKATGFIRGGKTEPARRQAAVSGVPQVSGSPSVADERVIVGSRTAGGPDAPNMLYGYLSTLAPWRVLLCDSNRIVETNGSEPGWVCTGTSSPQRTQNFIGEDLQRAFSRPAQATRLPGDTILVVDSGNHRVVEIDRAGRVVWPLDAFGYEYYTSPDNRNLKLSRPAEAHRYYEVTGPNDFPVWYTVIADTGNARVVEIRTTFHDPDTMIFDGDQRHEVRSVTPTYVRGAEGRPQRVRYTSAAPIRDPKNDAVVGYLCAASNLNQLLVVTAGDNPVVNPFATVKTVGGTETPNVATWRYWSWLYDPDPDDGDNVSNQPLQFENIKHVDLQRAGDTLHVLVTATRYLGRFGEVAHPVAQEGAGVFEFRIDVSSDDPLDWELDRQGAGSPWPTADPHWYFAGADYKGRPMTTISTAAGDYDKRWYPVCAERISTDTVLITNSLSQIENVTYENLGPDVRDAVLGSHIFEVMTDAAGHNLDEDRSVPAPGEMWVDPFTQPAHAEISR